jgi:capsular polysaccharide biosynthesis protein
VRWICYNAGVFGVRYRQAPGLQGRTVPLRHAGARFAQGLFMNPMDYVKVIVRRWWIIALTTILVGVSAFAFSRIQTPVYRATQQILVKAARNDNGLVLTLVNLLNSYKAWMDTKDLAAQVITYDPAHPLDMTPDQLKSMVTVSVDRNANLLNVDVDMRDGDTANRVARAYGELFRMWREKENAPLRLEDRITAELLDYPSYGQIRPQTTTNTLAGLLLGVLIGGVVVFFLETLSARVIRRSADVEQTLNLPVLGAIPENEARPA